MSNRLREEEFRVWAHYLACLDTLHDFIGERNKSVDENTILQYSEVSKAETALRQTQLYKSFERDYASYIDHLSVHGSYYFASFEDCVLRFVKLFAEKSFGHSVSETVYELSRNYRPDEFNEIAKGFSQQSKMYIRDQSLINNENLCGNNDNIAITVASMFDSKTAQQSYACGKEVAVNAALSRAQGEMMELQSISTYHTTKEDGLIFDVNGQKLLLPRTSFQLDKRVGVEVFGNIVGGLLDANLSPYLKSVFIKIFGNIPPSIIDTLSIKQRIRMLFDYKRTGDWLQIASYNSVKQLNPNTVFLTNDRPAVARAIVSGPSLIGMIPTMYTAYNTATDKYTIRLYGTVELTEEYKKQVRTRLVKISYFAKTVDMLSTTKETPKVATILQDLDDMCQTFTSYLAFLNKERARIGAIPHTHFMAHGTDLISVKFSVLSSWIEVQTELCTKIIYMYYWLTNLLLDNNNLATRIVEDAQELDEVLRKTMSANQDDKTYIYAMNRIVDFEHKHGIIYSDTQYNWLSSSFEKGDIKACTEMIKLVKENHTHIMYQMPLKGMKVPKSKQHMANSLLATLKKFTQLYDLYDAPPSNARVISIVYDVYHRGVGWQDRLKKLESVIESTRGSVTNMIRSIFHIEKLGGKENKLRYLTLLNEMTKDVKRGVAVSRKMSNKVKVNKNSIINIWKDLQKISRSLAKPPTQKTAKGQTKYYEKLMQLLKQIEERIMTNPKRKVNVTYIDWVNRLKYEVEKRNVATNAGIVSAAVSAKKSKPRKRVSLADEKDAEEKPKPKRARLAGGADDQAVSDHLLQSILQTARRFGITQMSAFDIKKREADTIMQLLMNPSINMGYLYIPHLLGRFTSMIPDDMYIGGDDDSSFYLLNRKRGASPSASLATAHTTAHHTCLLPSLIDFRDLPLRAAITVSDERYTCIDQEAYVMMKMMKLEVQENGYRLSKVAKPTSPQRKPIVQKPTSNKMSPGTPQ